MTWDELQEIKKDVFHDIDRIYSHLRSLKRPLPPHYAHAMAIELDKCKTKAEFDELYKKITKNQDRPKPQLKLKGIHRIPIRQKDYDEWRDDNEFNFTEGA